MRLACSLLVSVAASAVAHATLCVASHADVLDDHPNAAELKRALAAPADGFAATGVTRADYLKLMAANADFFKQHQDARGAIIDPVSKGERQYSTPAFALVAGLFAAEGGRADLAKPARRAMTHALTALVEKRSADGHADFYIPLLVHAHRALKKVAPADEVAAWEAQFRRIDIATAYNAQLRDMNWNVVSSCGELLRRKDGLVAPDMRDAQLKYLKESLAGHLDRLKPLGLFEDPGAPMAYDAFTRLWLEDAFADGAYDGAHRKRIDLFLRTGGLTTLLLVSPTGEWPPGGRSAMHNWADAQLVAICEANAAHWKRAGRADLAGAFKRAAHRAFESAARWQRPSGELNVVKNRAEPGERLAYESYSHHSQYNLLPMAMLALAHARADESVDERPMPSEVGGYVLDARETFHKIAAAAGGYYVVVDTAADAGYNATGLQRVHHAGVPFPALSNSAAGARSYGPKDAPRDALAPGVEWQVGGGDWLGLADFSGGAKTQRRVADARLDVESAAPERVAFRVTYALVNGDAPAGEVVETYTLTSAGVTLDATVPAGAAAYRVGTPVLVSDGATDRAVQFSDRGVSVTHDESVTSFDFGAQPELVGPRVPVHAGYCRAAVAPAPTNAARLTITLK